jgi:HK97 family phage major capsid protein
MKITHLNLALICAMAVLAALAVAGHPVISPEMIAASGMVPFAIGDTDFKQLQDLLEKQGKALEEFKAANDKLLEAKAEGKAVSDLQATVEKINSEITQLGKDISEVAKKQNRPQIESGQTKLTDEQLEHRSAFMNFMRKGVDTGLSDLERKALQRGSDVDGGYLVPVDIAEGIDRVASTISVVRSLADVRTIGTNKHQARVKTSGMAARWVGEGETGGESANAKYGRIEIDAEELEVEPWVYNDTLEDADFDLEADVTNEAGIGLGEAEGVAFITGSGVKRPRGILTYDTVVNSSYTWGKVGFIKSGADGAFATSNPSDKIIDLIHSLKAQYRNGAVLLMADTTLAEVRKLKDGSGNFYLFNPDPTGKFSGFVLGVPVEIDDNMPVVASNSLSIAYANFKRAYRIVDRSGIALIRDNITTKGTTKFNFRKRVGAGIINFEAIKLMKFAS